MISKLTIIALAASVAVAAAHDKPALEKFNVREYKKEIKNARIEKDLEFKQDGSPLSDEIRKTFKALNYFEPDANFRFELPLDTLVAQTKVKIADTKGHVRDGEKLGVFKFQVRDTACSLVVYRIQNAKGKFLDDYYFVPFTDQTTGKSTYKVGRYVEAKKLPSGKFLLDFNTAYNPYCAYSDKYSCPIPPKENALPVELTAGEKAFEH
jgi:uncharacterized protein (DUF1684 family)